MNRSDARDERGPVRGRAFGIGVASEYAIPELPAATTPRGTAATTLELAEPAELEREWPAKGSERLIGRVHMDGRLMMAVDRHADAGYRVWAPRYGRHLVSFDGSSVRSALPAVAAWRWERLLFAQVLPLSAALRGRELFHASAVSLGGSAFAFVGLSGSGKSSLAAHLVARGATLVTDDVLALEPTRDGVLAHPGTRLKGVAEHELRAMSTSGRARLGRRVGKADKVYLSVKVAGGPLPLRGLYYLTRVRGGRLRIRDSGSLPSRLLGSSFIAYLDSPEHLVKHLEVCTHLAATVPVLELSIPRNVAAPELAEAVERHAASLAAERG
jgi:hypothetical protein